MVFLPHTNTVILLEPYCGTITEPGLPVGRQRYAFTPVQETFQEVQDNHWEEVETTLKELDGTLVQFQSDSQCVIRLHFKKE